ncbi:lipid-A-disaccharide synthase [Thiohalomonas denitrificans]|uniref:lipid-A-disaccharide synthase n=1 Tax=Thiohalomonas denitrificans TaxID=415747 RepID=UPI00294FFFCC|nr:lipid-A-disaccharide synthase [Thiohalomonas denitrificans]
MIVAGEASGESRAARLVEEAHLLRPDVEFFGIGGPRMRAAGVKTLVDCRDMAVLGLFEILRHFRFIYGVLQRMRRLLASERPDLLVLVDYSGFNLKLAKSARQLGIPVFYYISPQVWAWRRKRVYTIKEYVDLMAVVFPFEESFYREYGVPVRYVGHPLVDEVGSDLTRDEAARAFGLDPARPIIGLFPGSRRSELQRLLPLLLEAATLLQSHIGKVQFLLPQSSSLDRHELDVHLESSSANVTVVEDRFYDVIRACDAVATASGTATLEVALMGVPLTVVYKVSPLSFAIMRRLIKLPHIAMCNIVAGRQVARELLQGEATPQALAAELEQLLLPQIHTRSVEDLKEVRGKLGEPGGARRAAELLDGMLPIR